MVVQKVPKIMPFPLMSIFLVPKPSQSKKNVQSICQCCQGVIPSGLELIFQLVHRIVKRALEFTNKPEIVC